MELLEEDGVPEPTPGPRSAGRVRRTWWVVLGVVAAALGTAAVVDHRQSAALDARLAGVPGLSAPLDRPLRVAWRAPGSALIGSAGDVVLALGADRSGIAAVDPDDGTVVWSHPGSCRFGSDPAGGTGTPGGAPGAAATGMRVRDRSADPLVCVEQRRMGGPVDAHVHAVAARVLDPVTGAVRRTVELDGLGGWRVVGPDLLTFGLAGDRHAEAARWSLRSGQPVWRYRSAAPLGPGVAWSSSVDGSVLRLGAGGAALTLDAATGRAIDGLPSDGAGPLWGPLVLPDGAWATSRFRSGGSAVTTVHGPDGAARVTVPGLLLVPAVDDGSATGTVFVVRGEDGGRQRVAAVDPVTGRTRWRSTAPVGQAVVLGGLLVVRDDNGLTALDTRTGTVRWVSTTERSRPTGWGLVTDGRTVLTLDGATRRPALVARDVVTGVTLWSAPVPVDGASLALLPDGTVVLLGTQEVVALQP